MISLRVLRLSGVLVWLVVLWVLLWNDATVANVISGILVGVAVLTFAQRPSYRRSDDDDRPRVNAGWLGFFVVYVLYQLVRSNLLLAWEIVTPRNSINTGVIAVPLRTDSDLAVVTIASVITLTPGTMTIDVLGSPPVIYVHVLHLDDIDGVRDGLLHLEKLAVRAFGSPSARLQLTEASPA